MRPQLDEKRGELYWLRASKVVEAFLSLARSGHHPLYSDSDRQQMIE